MPYTVTELITKAWNLSGIVAAQAETVSGDQLKEGLYHLNDLIALQNANARMIPYTRVHSFECRPKEDELLIDHLVKVDSITLYEQGISYTLQALGRKDFFTHPRQHYTPAQPRSYHIEPDKGGRRLFLSPTPDKSYRLRLVGKFGLTEVNYNDDLLAIYNREYIVYLRYGLAEYLCDLYNHSFSYKSKLREIEFKLQDFSPLDLSIEKIAHFRSEVT